jgi:hypothetical protein
MNKLALYQEDVDFKTYILKVSKVFKKMETDLGAYRLKDNNPERCLKMLKKVIIIIIILKLFHINLN